MRVCTQDGKGMWMDGPSRTYVFYGVREMMAKGSQVMHGYMHVGIECKGST